MVTHSSSCSPSQPFQLAATPPATALNTVNQGVNILTPQAARISSILSPKARDTHSAFSSAISPPKRYTRFDPSKDPYSPILTPELNLSPFSPPLLYIWLLGKSNIGKNTERNLPLRLSKALKKNKKKALHTAHAVRYSGKKRHIQTH